MNWFLHGKGFTWTILTLYGLRCLTYLSDANWGRALYWAAAIAITVAAEFLIKR